jgi:hypothetical protein
MNPLQLPLVTELGGNSDPNYESSESPARLREVHLSSDDSDEDYDTPIVRYQSTFAFDNQEFLGLTDRRRRFTVSCPIQNWAITLRFQRAFAKFRAVLHLSNVIIDI